MAAPEVDKPHTDAVRGWVLAAGALLVAVFLGVIPLVSQPLRGFGIVITVVLAAAVILIGFPSPRAHVRRLLSRPSRFDRALRSYEQATDAWVKKYVGMLEWRSAKSAANRRGGELREQYRAAPEKSVYGRQALLHFANAWVAANMEMKFEWEACLLQEAYLAEMQRMARFRKWRKTHSGDGEVRKAQERIKERLKAKSHGQAY